MLDIRLGLKKENCLRNKYVEVERVSESNLKCVFEIVFCFRRISRWADCDIYIYIYNFVPPLFSAENVPHTLWLLV